MENNFENLCRFCLSCTESSSLSLKNDKILIRLQNKFLDLRKVLRELGLDSPNQELPSLICNECKNVVINFYQMQKTYRENESVLLGKTPQDEAYNHEKEKLLRTVEEFYSEFEDGDELNIIKYRDKLVIGKSNTAELDGHQEAIIEEVVEQVETDNVQFEQNEGAMREEYLIDGDEQQEENDSSEVKEEEVEPVKDPNLTISLTHEAKNTVETYSCSNCHASFTDEKSASEHLAKYAVLNLCKASQCSDCGISFQSEMGYQKHIGYHFLAKMSDLFAYHDCSVCRVTFGSLKEFNQHAKHHAENSNFVYKFEGRQQIEGCEILPRETPASDSAWSCGHCNMQFQSRNGVNFHLTLFHANVSCPFCKQSFGKSVPYLVSHLKLKHPDKFEEIVFNCCFCNESFSKYHDMKLHEKNCSSKKYSCTHCEKKFALERQLKEHLDSIKGDFKYSCDDCKKLFTNKAALTVHRRIHSREKPYLCTHPGCEKSFRTNSQVSAHMDLHSESKNFKCKYCQKLFQTRGARRVHEKTHYEENVCKICNSVLKQRSHLIRHVNFIHKIKCDSKSMDEQVDLHLSS